MLRLSHFTPVLAGPDIEFDSYVPLTLTWPGYHRSLDAPRSYLMGGRGNYLELKFERSSGELVEVVLVSAASITLRDVDSAASVVDERAVLPVFDLHTLNSDSAEGVQVYITAYVDMLEIRIGESRSEFKTGGPVVFGVTGDKFLSLLSLMWTEDQRSEFIDKCCPTLG